MAPVALGLAVLSLVLTGCFKMGSDAEALRNSVVQSAGAQCEKEFELGVGALTLGIARVGLGFIELEPEARAAVDAVRGADVGVYRLRNRPVDLDSSSMLLAADETMTARGWDRVVGVVSGREVVALYVPARLRSERDVQVCLFVLDNRELVVASARTNLKPLFALVADTAELKQKTLDLVGNPRD